MNKKLPAEQILKQIQMLRLDANDKIISSCILVPYRELELGVAMSVVSFECNGSRHPNSILNPSVLVTFLLL